MDHELNKWAKSERRWALAGIARLPGAAAQRRPAAAAAVLLLLALLANRRSLYRTGQDAFASIYYGLDPAFLGRSEALYPAPRCCHDEGCVAPRTPPRAAVVTYLRGADYLPLLQQLECTLARSNPGGLELAAMVVEGELDEALLARVRELGITLLPVAALEYPNSYERRYSRNWVKIRAFGLTQYDALLLVDADEAVVGDLSPLFALPAEFAAVWDQSRWLGRWKTAVRLINGGVFFLRPCPAIEAHMLALLEGHPKLRFRYGCAEQDFFSWYFRYTGLTLPLQYNCQAEQSLEGNLTVGGLPPKIVHFTERKPFHGPIPGAPGHHFLCSAEELAARPAAVAAAAAAVVGAAAVQGARQQQEQQRRGEAAAAAASGGGVPGALAAGG